MREPGTAGGVVFGCGGGSNSWLLRSMTTKAAAGGGGCYFNTRCMWAGGAVSLLSYKGSSSPCSAGVSHNFDR